MKRLAMLLIVPLLALAACGGGPQGETGTSSASAKATLDSKDAELKFAQCMRDNGVDFPDPGTKEAQKGVLVTDAYEKAGKACEKWRRASSSYVDPLDPEVMDGKAKYAQCMRERGMKVHDPDPKTGGYTVEVTDKDKNRFIAASGECKHHLVTK